MTYWSKELPVIKSEPFLHARKKVSEQGLEKKKEEEAPRKFKKWSANTELNYKKPGTRTTRLLNVNQNERGVRKREKQVWVLLTQHLLRVFNIFLALT